MADITKLNNSIIQGEGKWFKFTYTRDGVAMVMPAYSEGIYSFVIKSEIGATVIYEAVDFDDSLREEGTIRVNLPASASILLTAGGYAYAEMEAVIVADSDVDKKIIKFKVDSKV